MTELDIDLATTHSVSFQFAPHISQEVRKQVLANLAKGVKPAKRPAKRQTTGVINHRRKG